MKAFMNDIPMISTRQLNKSMPPCHWYASPKETEPKKKLPQPSPLNSGSLSWTAWTWKHATIQISSRLMKPKPKLKPPATSSTPLGGDEVEGSRPFSDCRIGHLLSVHKWRPGPTWRIIWDPSDLLGRIAEVEVWGSLQGSAVFLLVAPRALSSLHSGFRWHLSKCE